MIELLVDMLSRLRPRPSKKFMIWQHMRLRRRTTRTIRQLQVILNDPAVIQRSIERKTRRQGTVKTGISIAGRASVDGSLEASAHTERGESGEGEASKIERLRSLAPGINKLLVNLVQETDVKKSLVFVDDYYFIATQDQPLVLDYLHAVCKGTGVWLKVGGVGSRLKLYQEGDPPVGVQIGQDVSRLKLDVTLEDFARAKAFLEQVLNGILQPVGMAVQNVMNDGARNRIVLASGGAVPRDYINLVLDALDIAVDRVRGDDASSGAVRIQTEDINRAARRRTNEKEEEELRQDAGADAPALRDRWQDIQAFAKNRGETTFVLFRQGDLTDTEWGRQIEQLENLRLLHRIGTAVPNTATWRQVRVIIMMIDLAAIVNQRLSANIVEFWKGQAEFDKLRRAQWVYDPDWRASLKDQDEVGTVIPKKPAGSKDESGGLW
ncbi:hypothetical protein [Lentzea atacamensis]|uniref:hypothetical protein n=1 Tax=Lentzea atacamensis TaxID=531938 RepID=UPI0011B3B733|nr:hypothetical protein [Lentzea atacamensis]